MAIRYDEETGQYYDDGYGDRAQTQNLGHEFSEGSGGNDTGDPNDPNRNATPEQIAAAERGPNVEGRSATPDNLRAAYDRALANGVPKDWADEWLARNPNDENRLEDVWADEVNPGGWDPSNGPQPGAGGAQGNQGAFAPPPNTTGWMPTLELPTWTPPAAFAPPPAFSYGELPAYPEYQKPADYVPGEFSYGEYQKPADYVPGTFSAPTIEEARGEPGFQFALDEGRRQMEASAAAKGIGRTGGTVKRLIGYGQEMADTNYNIVFNRNKSTFDTNETNREQAYQTNAGLGLGAWQANRGNAFDNFVLNEGNRSDAYKTNADLGFGAWNANRGNAADTWAANYGLAKDKYGFDYTAAQDTWKTGYDTSKQQHDYDTAEALGEYAPKKTEAELTHAQAFAEWLAKMGIAKNIFDEGSD